MVISLLHTNGGSAAWRKAGNGVDIGAVYRLLTEVAETVRGHSDRFDGIDRRLGGIDHHLHGIDDRLANHDRKLNEPVSAANEHSGKFEQVLVVLNDHSRRLDDLAFGMADLRTAPITTTP